MKFLINPWASGVIRGKQIAERLGGIASDSLALPCDDTLVIVKAWNNNLGGVCRSVKNVAFDIVDGVGLIPRIAAELPYATVIAIGAVGVPFLSARMPNKIVFIPEHNCNFENVIRENRSVKVVGYCGYKEGLWLDNVSVAQALNEAGFDFKYVDVFSTREDVVDFYRSIDIQISFRGYYWGIDSPPELKNPLKILNAGSFKIPTVCFPEHCILYELGHNCIVPAFDLNGIVAGCMRLRDSNEFYENIAGNAHALAQFYHIDKIVDLYRRLDDGTIVDARRGGLSAWQDAIRLAQGKQ